MQKNNQQTSHAVKLTSLLYITHSLCDVNYAQPNRQQHCCFWGNMHPSFFVLLPTLWRCSGDAPLLTWIPINHLSTSQESAAYLFSIFRARERWPFFKRYTSDRVLCRVHVVVGTRKVGNVRHANWLNVARVWLQPFSKSNMSKFRQALERWIHVTPKYLWFVDGLRHFFTATL